MLPLLKQRSSDNSFTFSPMLKPKLRKRKHVLQKNSKKQSIATDTLSMVLCIEIMRTIFYPGSAA